jgi:hypothetical protein
LEFFLVVGHALPHVGFAVFEQTVNEASQFVRGSRHRFGCAYSRLPMPTGLFTLLKP